MLTLLLLTCAVQLASGIGCSYTSCYGDCSQNAPGNLGRGPSGGSCLNKSGDKANQERCDTRKGKDESDSCHQCEFGYKWGGLNHYCCDWNTYVTMRNCPVDERCRCADESRITNPGDYDHCHCSAAKFDGVGGRDCRAEGNPDGNDEPWCWIMDTAKCDDKKGESTYRKWSEQACILPTCTCDERGVGEFEDDDGLMRKYCWLAEHPCYLLNGMRTDDDSAWAQCEWYDGEKLMECSEASRGLHKPVKRSDLPGSGSFLGAGGAKSANTMVFAETEAITAEDIAVYGLVAVGVAATASFGFKLATSGWKTLVNSDYSVTADEEI